MRERDQSNLFFDSYGSLKEGWFLVGLFLSIVFFFALLCMVIRNIDHDLKVQACSTFSKESGYQTKWVDYNFWYYDCLAKTDNNKWISTQNLYDVSQRK